MNEKGEGFCWGDRTGHSNSGSRAVEPVGQSVEPHPGLLSHLYIHINCITAGEDLHTIPAFHHAVLQPLPSLSNNSSSSCFRGTWSSLTLDLSTSPSHKRQYLCLPSQKTKNGPQFTAFWRICCGFCKDTGQNLVWSGFPGHGDEMTIIFVFSTASEECG